MKPELPYLAAGGVAIAGGAIQTGKWPANTPRVLMGTVVLVLVASASTNTRVGPLVHAIGLLLLLTTVMAAVRAANKRKKK